MTRISAYAKDLDMAQIPDEFDGARLRQMVAADPNLRNMNQLDKRLGKRSSSYRWAHNKNGPNGSIVAKLCDIMNTTPHRIYGLGDSDVRDYLERAVSRELGSDEGRVLKILGTLSTEEKRRVIAAAFAAAEILRPPAVEPRVEPTPEKQAADEARGDVLEPWQIDEAAMKRRPSGKRRAAKRPGGAKKHVSDDARRER